MEEVNMTANIPTAIQSPNAGTEIPRTAIDNEIEALAISQEVVNSGGFDDAGEILAAAKDRGFEETFEWLATDELEEGQPVGPETIDITPDNDGKSEDKEQEEDTEDGSQEVLVDGQRVDVLEEEKHILEEENKELKEKAQRDAENLKLYLEAIQFAMLLLMVRQEKDEEGMSPLEALVNIIGFLMQSIVMPDDENPLDKIGQEASNQVSKKQPQKKISADELLGKMQEQQEAMRNQYMGLAA